MNNVAETRFMEAWWLPPDLNFLQAYGIKVAALFPAAPLPTLATARDYDHLLGPEIQRLLGPTATFVGMMPKPGKMISGVGVYFKRCAPQVKIVAGVFPEEGRRGTWTLSTIRTLEIGKKEALNSATQLQERYARTGQRMTTPWATARAGVAWQALERYINSLPTPYLTRMRGQTAGFVSLI